MHLLIIFLFALAGFLPLQATEALPPAPEHYFNDYAAVVSPAVSQRLNQQLSAFDRATSNQIVVAIYPKLFTDSSLDDIAQQLYSSWHLGTKKNSNGVLLLIFPNEHKIRIQTGYGLEGALPDVTCKHIIDNIMAPAFRLGDYNSGLQAGVNAIIKATKGEYQGTHHPQAQKRPWWLRLLFSPLSLFLLFMFFSSIVNWRRQRLGLGSSGGWFIGGGGFGGENNGGGFGGGFSGGGGDSGGGGADGGW